VAGTYGDIRWGETMAAAVVGTIPVFMLFLLFQRWLVAGLTSGRSRDDAGRRPAITADEDRDGRPETRIDGVDAWRLRIPLATPIVLGHMVIAHREFCGRPLCGTAGGLEGFAYSLTRDAPLDLVLTEYLGPRLVGQDALDTERIHEELVRGAVSLGAVGLVGRGISLLDICLWDIKGRAAGMPVWRLLGGHAATAPVGLVAPYAGGDEHEDAYAERLASLAARGYDNLKLYPLSDPDAMRRRLAAIRERVGPDIGLVVDMAWSFRSVPDAVAAVGAGRSSASTGWRIRSPRTTGAPSVRGPRPWRRPSPPATRCRSRRPWSA